MAQSKRSFEIHTLHFSLFHAPAGVQHTLHVGTDTYPLTAHTKETLARHAAGNPVLASMATPEKSVSHFAEGVRLPSDAIVLTRVQHPSKDPQSPLQAMSLVSLHIPAAGRAQAKAANPQAHAAMVSKKMVVLGAAPPAPSDSSGASDDGSDYVN